MNVRYYCFIPAVAVVSLFTAPLLAEELERELSRLSEVSGGTMGVVMEGCERTIAEVARAAHDDSLFTSK